MLRLLVGLVLTLVATAFAAAAQNPSPASDETIVFQGRYYGTEGRGILCHVDGRKLACANSRSAVQCDDNGCTPRLGQQSNFENVDDDVEVLLPQMAYLEPGSFGPDHVPMYVRAKVLRPGRFSLGPTACKLNGRALVCRLRGAAGGFQIAGSGFQQVDNYLRVQGYDDAPEGWPWDGKRHGLGDVMPAAAFRALSAPARPSDSAAAEAPGDDWSFHLWPNEIRIADGEYFAADEKILCKAHGALLACTNGRDTVQCSARFCEPRRAAQTPGARPDNSVWVALDDPKKFEPASLPDGGTRWVLGPAACEASPRGLHCVLLTGESSFQMDGLFARISSFDDAPADWPFKRGSTEFRAGLRPGETMETIIENSPRRRHKRR